MVKSSLFVQFSLIVTSLVAAVGIGGEKPGKIYHESAEISLVEVPVNVVGRDGLPVRGLVAQDFEIKDEGRPQELTALDVVDLKRNRPSNELAETLPEAARRHFLFLFDFSFATPNEIVRSRQAAMEFIERDMGPEDRAAVATTSVEIGPRLLVNFTADRKQLAAAIHTLGLPNILEQARDPLAFEFVFPGDPNLKDFIAPGENTISAKTESQADYIAAQKVYTNMARKTSDQYSETRVSRHLGEMGGLANALDTVQGTKRIVYFSEGFDGRLIFGGLSKTASDTRADNDAMLRGNFWALDVDKRYLNSPLALQISDTMELFRRSDCIVYAVDIARLRADGDATLGEHGDGEETLFLFAHETGGELIQNGNDLVGALRRINEKTSVTYVLSFRPTVKLGEGKFHRLKVNVRRKGARVSARAGYYEARGFQAMTPLERSLAAADVINGGRPKGEIPVDTLAVPLPDSGFARVPVVIQIPGRELAAPASADKLHLGIYVYVTDEQGALADFFTRSVSLDLARNRGQLSSGDFRYSAVCHLLPGRYRLRVYVRDEDSGRYGFTASTLDIPDFVGAKLHTMPPLFVSDTGNGVNLRDSTAPAAPEADNPFEVGGVSFVPRLDPSITAGGESKICLMIYREGADTARPFAIEAQILDAGGRPRGPARVTLIGRSRTEPGGMMKLLLEFSAGDLPPGSYSLKVTIRDARESGLASSGEALFTVS
jgi:VWFA-related protein